MESLAPQEDNPFASPMAQEDTPFAPPVASVPRPWSFWATTGLSLVVLVAFIVLQTLVTIGFVVVSTMLQPGAPIERVAADAGNNGLLLSLVCWISMPICLGLVLLFTKLRRDWTVAEYLALRPVSAGTLLGWIGILLAFCFAWDAVGYLIGRPVVSEFMREVYQTASWRPLLWATLVVAAPAFEETFFRGFMLRGLRSSWLGATGSVLVTSAIWTALHLQYDAYSLLLVFLVGLLLGAARLKSESLYPPLAMHAAMNLVATLETAYWLS